MSEQPMSEQPMGDQPMSELDVPAEPLEHWVFGIRIHDRPGALSAVASVFSQRGVSLRTTVAGAGGLAPRAVPARPSLGAASALPSVSVVLSFLASRRRMINLRRTVERLAVVQEVQTYPYESPRLRAVVMAHLLHAADEPPTAAEPLRLEPIAAASNGSTVMVSGPPAVVDQWLTEWSDRGRLAEAVKAVMVV